MSENNLISIPNEDFLKLVSAQIVLDVLKKSSKILNDELNKEKQNEIIEDIDDKSIKIVLEENTVESWQIKFPKNTNKKNNLKKNDQNSTDSINYIEHRKYFSVKRWNCISRPQYKYSCGISSLVSCWNYLYSTLGHGNLKPLKQEEALKILGFSEPFSDIRFGPFTGNVTLMKWFQKLLKHFCVFGQASFFYKPVGANKTFGINGNMAKERLQNLIKSNDNAFIYHCYNHYCCPIGYEKEPLEQTQIYSSSLSNSNSSEEFQDWILIADTSRKHQGIHCVKWSDIDQDLNTKMPEYLNIRHLELGIQTKSKLNKSTNVEETLKNIQKKERNLHCIIQFKKLDFGNVNIDSENFTSEILNKSSILLPESKSNDGFSSLKINDNEEPDENEDDEEEEE